METRAPDSKLTNFGFESLLKPGYVPNAQAVLVPKPAANPIYALVNCGLSNTRYAIRWQNRFLTVVTGDVVSWTDQKEEPNSCFAMIPGWCKTANGDEYVMLRSATNGHFVRADDATGKLVCKDSPTQNTALKYCWKLRGPVLASEVTPPGQCGCQFDPNAKAVVCKPCTVATSAAPATPAPLPGPWPELIGWDVQQAKQFLEKKYPHVAIFAFACPAKTECPISVANPPGQPYVILRYSAETGRILFTPSVAMPGGGFIRQQPITIRI